MSAMTKSTVNGSVGRNMSPSATNLNEECSDDSQYASYPDNESFIQMDTSDEEEEHDEVESQTNGRDGGRQLRNNNNQCELNHIPKTFDVRSAKFGRNVSISTSSSLEDTKRNIQRMPTRRPNPKVFNRNALMARENRKKKKEHLETLERDVDVLKHENTSLRKLLNKRSAMVTKLREERLYLKSIIANKTSIMSLLKTIQGNQIPITSSTLSFVTEDPIEPASGTSSRTESTCSGYLHDEIDDLPAIRGSPTHSLASHCSSDSSSASVCAELPLDSWESLLAHDTEFRSDPYYIPRLTDADYLDEQLEDTPERPGQILAEPTPTCQRKVSHEHNYSNNNIYAQSGKRMPQSDRTTVVDQHAMSMTRAAGHLQQQTTQSQSADDLPGICLHLSGGRVSLEFCGSCHRHSKDAWDEEM